MYTAHSNTLFMLPLFLRSRSDTRGVLSHGGFRGESHVQNRATACEEAGRGAVYASVMTDPHVLPLCQVERKK